MGLRPHAALYSSVSGRVVCAGWVGAGADAAVVQRRVTVWGVVRRGGVVSERVCVRCACAAASDGDERRRRGGPQPRPCAPPRPRAPAPWVQALLTA